MQILQQRLVAFLLFIAGILLLDTTSLYAQKASPVPIAGIQSIPGPLITQVSPNPVVAQSTATVSIIGSNFSTGATILFNGRVITPVFISPNELRIILSPSDIPTAGAYTIVVQNAPSVLSNTATLNVSMPPTPPDRLVHWVHGLGEHGVVPTLSHMQTILERSNIPSQNLAPEHIDWTKRAYWLAYGLQYGSERKMTSNVIEYSSIPSTIAPVGIYSGGCGIQEIATLSRRANVEALDASLILPIGRGAQGFAFPPQATSVAAPIGQPKPLLIGHSTGGIVARELDKQFPTTYGGIITIGSPNFNGGPIIRSIRDGRVDAVIQNAKNRLTIPLAFDILRLAGLNIGEIIAVGIGGAVLAELLQVLSSPEPPANFLNWAAWTLGYGVYRPIQKTYAYGCQQTLNDMDPGTPLVPNTYLPVLETNDATANLNTPRISLVGNAYQKEHFRLMYSFFNPPVTSLNNLDITKIETRYRTDEDYITLFSVLEAAYAAAGAVHGLAGALNLVEGFVNPTAWIEAAIDFGLMAGYWSGAAYIGNESEWDYLKVIGAAERQRVEVTTWFLFIPIRSSRDVDVRLRNDGLFSETTQTMRYSEFRPEYRCVGANHFTEGNHPAVRQSFNDLFANKFRIPNR